jgi:ATP-binding cassette subfamily B protein
MRRRLGSARAATALLALGWRSAPGLMTVCALVATVGALASVGYTLGFRTVIDAAERHDQHEIVFGVALIAVLFSTAWAFGILGASRNSVLTDRINLELGGHIGRLVGSLPGLEHFERTDDLRRIDQLRAGRRSLAAGPVRLLSTGQVALRSGAVVVLLATVYPPILVVPAFALAPALANRRARRLQQASEDELAEDRRLVEDLFVLATAPGSARELRTYGIAGAVADRHALLGEEIRRRSLSAALRASAWEALGWIVFAAGFVGAIVALVLRAAHGHVSPGGVVMAVSLMRRAQTQVARGSDSAAGVSVSLQTAEHLRWLEDEVARADAIAAGNRAPAPNLHDGIRLEGVDFAYPGSDALVLEGVDLHLPAGATVALVGENGAGKSTIVKLLCGMYRPTAGALRVEGVDLGDIALTEWRGRTTATFQDYLRLQLRAGQAVGVGDLPHVDDADAVHGALHRAGGDDVVTALPDGLETQLGRAFGGRELSGGQWQRLALARGLMRPHPLLIVLDEPTASVDAPTERALFHRYARAARAGAEADGAITLLVSHRFANARTADVIVVLDQGRVVDVGAHAELIARGGLYAELYELQARAYRET